MAVTRMILDGLPALDATYRHEASPWPSSWIGPQSHSVDHAVVLAYRLRFTLEAAAQFTAYVSADQRYELFVDGEPVGRGPERGDRANWFFEAYRLRLPAGEHVIVARTWWLSDRDPGAPAPYAQISIRPAFWFHADGELGTILSTGLGAWEVKALDGYAFSFASQNAFTVVGARTVIDGRRYPWGFENGATDGWASARRIGPATPGWLRGEWPDAWLLRPGTLPAMERGVVRAGVMRWVSSVSANSEPIRTADDLPAEHAAWDALLSRGQPVVIPSQSKRRIIIDLQDYFCAFPRLTVTGGRDATVRLHWAEALHVAGDALWDKGNRDEIEGKIFRGMGASYTLDGGAARFYQPLWWDAGRYVEIVVTTADEPLSIDDLALLEVHYPHTFESSFTSSDARHEALTSRALRTLEMCSHETYYDCPYYEQMMYVGDTRLEALVTYATTRDDRLPRKAIDLFDASRTPDGLTQARYPTRVRQTIPPFSLWWVSMVHDYAMWCDDLAFVRERMPGVRAVLDAFRTRINASMLLDPMPGWNFVDWVNGWGGGVPLTGTTAPTAIQNFHLVWTLRQAAELEELMDETELAARNLRTADTIARAAHETFWDESRGLYADDLGHEHFSEHAQCLAILSDSVPDAFAAIVGETLFDASEKAPTTIYFTHYYFEACRKLGRIGSFFDRLEPWFDLARRGLKTTVEMPEPTRSDCHAWGTHPLFHFYATILGIRPASAGFKTVTIEPHLGPLTHASGRLVHPRGFIEVDLRAHDEILTGSITLPEGVTGRLIANGKTLRLCGGRSAI